MNDTMVTVVGNVVDSPRLVRLKDTTVTNFRLASTARRWDAASERFVDASTFWVDVECWNALSGHVSGAISKGDPVIVHGMLSTHSWESDSGRRSRPQIKAVAVGPNLARCTAEVRRLQRPASAEPPVATTDDGEHVDPSTGEVLDTADGDPAGEGGAALEDEFERLVAGRDYETDPVTLEGVTADGPPAAPAHA